MHHWQAELQLIRFPYLSDMESGKAAKLHLQQTVQQTLTFAVFYLSTPGTLTQPVAASLSLLEMLRMFD